MERSDSIAELAAAMARAEAKMTSAKKDAQNPYFKSKYADLASIRAACLPFMNAEGLAVLQFPRVSSDEPGGPLFVEVETVITHASGEFMRDVLRMPVSKVDPQAIGSLVSYARRYSLAAVCSVAPLDDDAESAVTHGDTDEGVTHAVTPPSPSEERATITVRDVRQQMTKTGGTKFTIITREGDKYGTFKRDYAELARTAKASGAPLEVVYKVTTYGRELVTLRDLSEPEPPL